MEVIWELGTGLSIPGVYSARMVNRSPFNQQAETNLVLGSSSTQAEQAHRLIEFPCLWLLGGLVTAYWG